MEAGRNICHARHETVYATVLGRPAMETESRAYPRDNLEEQITLPSSSVRCHGPCQLARALPEYIALPRPRVATPLWLVRHYAGQTQLHTAACCVRHSAAGRSREHHAPLCIYTSLLTPRSTAVQIPFPTYSIPEFDQSLKLPPQPSGHHHHSTQVRSNIRLLLQVFRTLCRAHAPAPVRYLAWPPLGRHTCRNCAVLGPGTSQARCAMYATSIPKVFNVFQLFPEQVAALGQKARCAGGMTAPAQIRSLHVCSASSLVAF